jgi:plastocyanin
LLAVAVAAGGCAASASGRGPVGVTIVTASGEQLAFVPAETAVAGPGRVEIRFRNGSTFPHNLVFVEGVTASTDAIVEPGATDEVVVDLAAPGSYRFVCTIHEGMAGSITVGPASAVGAATEVDAAARG